MSVRNRILGLCVTTALAAGTVLTAATISAPAARAESKVLKLHTFGSPRQPETKWIFEPLNADFKKDSNGTLSFQTYYGMALGGKARDLIAQAENGVVDMSYTLPAYTAGRFPILTAVELPFLGGTNVTTTGEGMSQVAWEWCHKYAMGELKKLKLITLNAIDAGVLHTTKTAVRKMSDLKGLKIRVAGRYIGMTVEALGGVPVQMPLPAVYESLARGQTQGMMIPWMITVPFKLSEVTHYHTDVPIYHSLLIIVMNKNSWNKLDAVQKKAVEMSTGESYSKRYGKLWDEGAEPGRALARKDKGVFIHLSAAEEARWRNAADAAHSAWIEDMNKRGLDGKKMFADLTALVQKYNPKK